MNALGDFWVGSRFGAYSHIGRLVRVRFGSKAAVLRLAHRVSITMEADFSVEALEDAIGRYGKPAVFNSDQGSQFTSVAFTNVLLGNDIAIRMDGKGAWRDNLFVERLWKSVKYEGSTFGPMIPFLKPGPHSADLDFYNCQRPHSSLDRRTPDEAYFGASPMEVAA